MSGIIDLAAVRSAREKRQVEQANEPVEWEVSWAMVWPFARFDRSDQSHDPGLVNDARQAAFDFSREDAIYHRLSNAWKEVEAARDREMQLLGELFDLKERLGIQ